MHAKSLPSTQTLYVYAWVQNSCSQMSRPECPLSAHQSRSGVGRPSLDRRHSLACLRRFPATAAADPKRSSRRHRIVDQCGSVPGPWAFALQERSFPWRARNVTGISGSKYPPAKPGALRLGAPQRGPIPNLRRRSTVTGSLRASTTARPKQPRPLPKTSADSLHSACASAPRQNS